MSKNMIVIAKNTALIGVIQKRSDVNIVDIINNKDYIYDSISRNSSKIDTIFATEGIVLRMYGVQMKCPENLLNMCHANPFIRQAIPGILLRRVQGILPEITVRTGIGAELEIEERIEIHQLIDFPVFLETVTVTADEITSDQVIEHF